MIRPRTTGARTALAPLAAGLALGMVAPLFAAPVITRTDRTALYTPSEIMAAKRNDSLPVEVHGGPSARATPAATTAPLQLPADVGGGRLVPVNTGSEAAEGTRIVLLFNTTDYNPETACGAPSQGAARRADGPLDVFAVLCEGKTFFSQAHLRDDDVSGEDDPGYANAMSQLFLALMPMGDSLEEDRPGR